MNYYPPEIGEKIRRATNAGRAADANAAGTGASFECGAFVRFSLRIDVVTKQVLEAKYKTSGCGFAIAAAESLSELVAGVKLNDLHGADFEVFKTEIEKRLGAFPEARAHCLEICTDALSSAFKDFRRARTEEYAGDDALICSCFGVSERTIENAVESESLESVEQITEVCRAGGGCGSCQSLIQEILDSHRRKNF